MKERTGLAASFLSAVGIQYNKRRREGKKMKKKIGIHYSAFVFLMGGVLVFSLIGCGSSIQTEEEIVTVRESQDTAGGKGAAGSLTEQLQAPERYVEEFSTEKITVTADAAIIVPDVKGIQTKRIKSRVFTQEDYDTVTEGLFGEVRLWERDMEAMEGSHGFTKGELTEKIAEVEAEKAELGGHGDWDYHGLGITFDEKIEELKGLLEAAPEEAVIVEVPGVVNYRERKEYSEENCLLGFIDWEGNTYRLDLDNMVYEGYCCPYFTIEREEKDKNGYSTYTQVYGTDSIDGIEALEDKKEDFVQKTKELVKKLGLSLFDYRGTDYYVQFSAEDYQEDSNHSDGVSKGKVALGVHFTRTVDGIPIGYSREFGDEGSLHWPEEELDIVYDENGIVSFRWSSPYEIEEESGEDVFLLPFGEIQNIFREMIGKRYEDGLEEGQNMEIFVNEVRRSYRRVRDKENLLEASLVPVWDFYGQRITSGEGFTEPYVFDDYASSILTINAMDGTVVNRVIGY